MSPNLDEELGKALRPVDPEEGFAERVMARIDSTPATLSRRWMPQRFRGWPAALAASIVLGVALIYGWQLERERRGQEARRQLVEALHITGEKLDLVYRSVTHESPPPPGDRSGA